MDSRRDHVSCAATAALVLAAFSSACSEPWLQYSARTKGCGERRTLGKLARPGYRHTPASRCYCNTCSPALPPLQRAGDDGSGRRTEAHYVDNVGVPQAQHQARLLQAAKWGCQLASIPIAMLPLLRAQTTLLPKTNCIAACDTFFLHHLCRAPHLPGVVLLVLG